MSKIIATITNIQNIEHLNIVTFKCAHNIIEMMSLDLKENIKIGTKVELNIKPSSVVILNKINDKSTISSNVLDATIINIDSGTLLASVLLQVDKYKIESIITLNSKNNMNLTDGDNVLILINSSDLSILRIINND
jgi:molybdopterin-binding protein